MTPWKIAATTILRNSALETLMLHRGPTAKFMPNSFVFPGGIVDLEGDSAFPEHKTNYDDSFSKINLGVFATDLPLRVAAARELFEEAGLLLTYDAHTRESKSITAEDDKSLTEWRDKIKGNTLLFADLFNDKMMLDVNSLIPWSNWLTPASYPKRYDTVFFVVPLQETSAVEFCQKEMQGAVWDLPSKFIAKCCNEEKLACPPPQFYELARLRLINSNDPEQLERMTNAFKICPQIALNSDEPQIRTALLPGDHLFEWKHRWEGMDLRTFTKDELRLDTNMPIHRMTFNENPMYTNVELHISNMEEMETKPHLFTWRETMDEQRKRILNEILYRPRHRE